MQPRAFDWLILAISVSVVSSAAVIIRAADAPSIVIATTRVALASLPLLAITAARRENPLGAGRSMQFAALAGVFIALHFTFWVASVKDTSVVTSVTLVATQPLWVAIVSEPLLKEPPARTMWIGVAVSAVGVLVMVSDDFGAGGDTLTGDVFALLGAMLAAGYIILGRLARSGGAGLRQYISVAYPTAAAILIVFTLVSGHGVSGYSTETYGLLVLLAIGPQLTGHTALNRSLGHLPAVTVAIAILGEPVGSTVLATIFLGQPPTLLEVVGGCIILAGVYLGIKASVASQQLAVVEAEA
jgi:drug/metabolite transporter (DMT)-like permease